MRRVAPLCVLAFLLLDGSIGGQTVVHQENRLSGVAPIALSAPNAERPTPSTFSIPISVDDVTGKGIIAFQFLLTYDPAVIDPFGPNFGCSTSGTLAGSAGQTAVCNVQPNGTLRVSISGASAMAGSGTALNITFKTDPAAIAGNVSPLDFSNIGFYSTAGEMPSTFTNGSVVLRAPTAAMATVSGRLLTPDGRGIRAGRVTLTDEAGLQRAVDVEQQGRFVFDEVALGRTYTLRASNRRFTFEPVILTVDDTITTADLIGISGHPRP